MAETTHLYFVAALPDKALSEQVWAWKQEVAAQYGSIRGTRVLPHITFIPPFHYLAANEPAMTDALRKAVCNFKPQELKLNGFGHFHAPKSYTLFVAVERTDELVEQHDYLNLYARTALKLPAKLTPTGFTPHMTIAYRDLDEEKFGRAWPAFKDRPFSDTMYMDRLWLLRHNGSSWEQLSELPFLPI